MKQSTVKIILGAAITLFACQAYAWGPETRRAIMNTALQLVRQEMPQGYFQATRFRYQDDLLRGASDGPAAFLEHDLRSIHDTISAITTQMQLLRQAREFGVGSYFSYRMGALGALVADLYLPFSIVYGGSPQEQELKRRIEADVDAQVATFSFKPTQKRVQYMRVPSDYFLGESRQFQNEAAEMISADYAKGIGYKGYLQKGAQAFYQRAVQAVADTWYTLLTPRESIQGGIAGATPSREALTWYFVDEIEYLLLVKQNLKEAETAYAHFSKVNPGIPKAYERVGDHFYAFGAKARAVEEYRVAAGFDTPERQSSIKKLARHYIDLGKELMAKAKGPDAPETALDEAVDAFRMALETDRTSREAGELLSQAQIAKKERDERLQMTMEILASAEKTMMEADQMADKRMYDHAITTYRKAIALCKSVSDEFKAQRDIAKETSAKAENQISKIMNQVLDDAQDAIDEGQKLVDDNMFDEGVAKYRSVEGILAVIPDDPSTTHGKTRQKLLEQASKKIEEAETARRRWEEEQERLRNQPPGAATTAGATPAAPQAPAAAPAMNPLANAFQNRMQQRNEEE
ncbi:MAG TPA: hypothetical protein PKY35_12820 [Candidatus Hydrogenedentes bacterium]|nr:hypothetical protein [Candidatus Hydrogenedentota bacterium]HOL77900.1 hypothetical protein [Candidatus Hydrogenedentota bacterium]HPO87130.1 hypothetical protein [Candidatus Hydrogenedentota bacterium]